MAASMAAYDEMVDGRGGVRPHWRRLLGASATLGARAMAERAERVAELAGGAGRTIDPLPFPLPPAEFAALADGLAQRARLLEALLADLYGPQQVLASGALPAALVFANPGFERACRGLPNVALHAYAADLLRGPDGQWRVLADRLDGASGIAGVLETRDIVSRAAPELLRPVQAEPLRPFFRAWRDGLARRAPGALAVLGASRAAPRWASHAALARLLGAATVELDDLAVSRGALVLKALGEPRRLDTLVRRVPTASLDPLEIAGAPGVPGLLDAVRRGAVQVLNSPGAELAEAPALAAFLPALSRALLGEPLRLATVPTLWLADRPALATVRQALRRWSVRPAMTLGRPVMPHDLDPARRAALDASIAARPWDWAASALVEPSTAPVATRHGLVPRPIVLRLFLVHDGAAWRALPGGLARIIADGEWPGEGALDGATVKDVLVLREEEPRAARLPPPRRLAFAASPASDAVPVRAALDSYRLGRCLEALGGIARLGRVALARAEGWTSEPGDAETALLAACLADSGISMEDGMAAGLWQALLPGGRLAGAAERAGQLLHQLRDRLEPDTVALLRRSLRVIPQDAAAAPPGADRVEAVLADASRSTLLAAGIAAEEAARGPAWRCLGLGRSLERARLTASVLACLAERAESRLEGVLGLALELSGAPRSAPVEPASALGLLAADRSNPRSLAFLLGRVAEHLDALPALRDLARRAEALGSRAAATGADDAVPRLREVSSETAAIGELVEQRLAGSALPSRVLAWGPA